MAWERLGPDCLVTNDQGNHVFVPARELPALLAGKKTTGAAGLLANGFVRDQLDFDGLAQAWRTRNAYLGSGPGLHILVLTLRCNHGCSYCQSGAGGAEAKGTDMSAATAKKCVDFAFNSPNPSITIEFQGGEPLLNWDVLKETVTYSRRKAEASGRRLRLALVSNFALMTEEKAKFLLDNEISICTSLDGPAALHNANRAYAGGDSHAVTVKWLRYFREKHDTQKGGVPVFKPGALLTVTRRSLPKYKEIIDEYVKQGLEEIFLRPLAPLGYAKTKWGEIGYDAALFTEFYRKSLSYILSLNRKGVPLREKMAVMLLEKIISAKDPGFLDSRCPCGAAIGQLAYNFDGDIYTCDEGRMAAWAGDPIFRVGNVRTSKYRDVIVSDASKACAAASNLETQPYCHRCAYRPYCGVCPVFNYEAQGSLAGNMPSNDRCALFKGIFGVLFSYLKSPGKGRALAKWVENEKK
ncbi:MAG: His-Xaa-Ser system radical SAM maturase HxsB [Elusimicrobiales bacterium]|nr:His-Xaa-Ser system radical SAM maturase HxsB [Elusimicrobiales bacterium]